MQAYNKSIVALVSGAVIKIIEAYVQLDPTVEGAIDTLVTAFLVYLIPNK